MSVGITLNGSPRKREEITSNNHHHRLHRILGSIAVGWWRRKVARGIKIEFVPLIALIRGGPVIYSYLVMARSPPPPPRLHKIIVVIYCALSGEEASTCFPLYLVRNKDR